MRTNTGSHRDVASRLPRSTAPPQSAERARQLRLFGIRVDALSFDEALAAIWRWLAAGERRCRYIVTPNINHVVLHQSDLSFRKAYEDASLVLPDGRYIVAAAALLGRPLRGPINGSDLVPALLEAARGRNLRVFLLGALPGVAERARDNIARTWPWIDVVGTYSPPVGFERSAEESRKIVSAVNAARPDLLVLGISPPKQESWIAAHAKELDVRVAICAGATIDYLARHKTRAPRWAQRIGAEWLFRVITEPRRLLGRYSWDAARFLPMFCRELATCWFRSSRNG